MLLKSTKSHWKRVANGLSLIALFAAIALFSMDHSYAQRAGRNRPTTVGSVLDIIQLKNGQQLHGLHVPGSDPNFITFLTERVNLANLPTGTTSDWLQTERRITENAIETAQARLDNLLRTTADGRFRAKLRFGLSECENQSISSDALDYRFAWLEIDRREVRRMQPVANADRSLMFFCWAERLSDIEQLSPAKARQQLSNLGIDTAGDIPDLSAEVPPRHQSDDEWHARMSLLRHEFDESFYIDGSMGRFFDRTEASAQLGQLAAGVGNDNGSILEGLLGGGLLGDGVLGGGLTEFGLDINASGLSGLGGKSIQEFIDDFGNAQKDIATRPENTNWYTKAIQLAEKKNMPYVLVSEVQPNLTQRNATVHLGFFCRDSTGSAWLNVWETGVTKSIDEIDSKRIAEMREDPQIKSILGLLGQFGSSDRLQDALSIGAATELAQQEATKRFRSFSERYSNRVLGPPLAVSLLDR